MDLIAPYLRKRIDNFETEEALEAFREGVKKAAADKLAVATFSLMGNSYGLSFFKEIAPFVEQIPSIKKLVLNDIFTQRDGDVVDSLKIITRIFQGKNIVAFDMSNNAIAPTGCQAIFELIKNMDKLKYFWANNCGLAQNGVIHIARAIEEGTCPLKLLSMTRNRIEVKAREVGRAIARLTNLEELIMFQNGIKEEGMVGLMEGLLHCHKLRKLDLSDNWFLGKSIDLLCKVIEDNKNLVELNVGDCNLSAPDHKKVISAMQSAKKDWHGFGYNYNELTHKGTAKNLLTELTRGNQLKWLHVKGNDFEEDLVEHFDNELKKLPHKVHVLYESSENEEDEEYDHDFKLVIEGLKNLMIEEHIGEPHGEHSEAKTTAQTPTPTVGEDKKDASQTLAPEESQKHSESTQSTQTGA